MYSPVHVQAGALSAEQDEIRDTAAAKDRQSHSKGHCLWKQFGKLDSQELQERYGQIGSMHQKESQGLDHGNPGERRNKSSHCD